jgi:hypothetical protein
MALRLAKHYEKPNQSFKSNFITQGHINRSYRFHLSILNFSCQFFSYNRYPTTKLIVLNFSLYNYWKLYSLFKVLHLLQKLRTLLLMSPPPLSKLTAPGTKFINYVYIIVSSGVWQGFLRHVSKCLLISIQKNNTAMICISSSLMKLLA